MAANAFVSSGMKRTADHFDDVRNSFHDFGGEDWAARMRMHGVLDSSQVYFDKGDETIGRNQDKARRKFCNRLWSTAMTRLVNSKFGWDDEDRGMRFQKPIAIGSTSLIAAGARGTMPTCWTVVKETLPFLWEALGGDTTPREVLIHRRVSDLPSDNETIIKLYKYRRFPDQKKHRLYMENASYGDLGTLIRRYARWRRYLPEPFLWFLFHKLVKALMILQQGHLGPSDIDTPPVGHLPNTGASTSTASAQISPQTAEIQTAQTGASRIRMITAQQAIADLAQSATWNMKEIQRRGKQLGIDGKGTKNKKGAYLAKLRAEYRHIIALGGTLGRGANVGSVVASLTGGGEILSANTNSIQDELLRTRTAITTLKRRLNTTGWREIVHRDICPSNIVLCAPNSDSQWFFYPIPKLADFGDAIQTSADDEDNPSSYQYETTEGINWSPPEASPGSTMRFSAKSNVYQLGLTMTYATYLNPDSVQEARQGTLTTSVPYRRILVETIRSCLHADPEERITPLALYELTRTNLADCTRYLTERAPDRFRIYSRTEAKLEDMATGFYQPNPHALALVDQQFPQVDVDPLSYGQNLIPPPIGRFYPYEDDNLDFFVNPDNGFLQREQPADEVLPQDVITIADRGEHYYNRLTDPNFDPLTFDASDTD